MINLLLSKSDDSLVVFSVVLHTQVLVNAGGELHFAHGFISLFVVFAFLVTNLKLIIPAMFDHLLLLFDAPSCDLVNSRLEHALVLLFINPDFFQLFLAQLHLLAHLGVVGL